MKSEEKQKYCKKIQSNIEHFLKVDVDKQNRECFYWYLSLQQVETKKIVRFDGNANFAVVQMNP